MLGAWGPLQARRRVRHPHGALRCEGTSIGALPPRAPRLRAPAAPRDSSMRVGGRGGAVCFRI